MKKSINMWAVRQDMPYEQAIGRIAEAGFEAVELNISEGNGYLTPETTETQIEKLRTTAVSAGLEIASLSTSLFWQYPLSSENLELRTKGIAIGKKMIESAAGLGTDCILIVPGAVKAEYEKNDVVSYDAAWNNSLDSLQKLIPIAEQHKVCIGIENVWNKFLLSPLEMKRFVEELSSPFAGVYFDVGNVLVNSFPEMWIRILGSLVKRIHLKDFRTGAGNSWGFVGLLEGDVNWPEVIKALQDIGYSGYLTAEVGPYRHYPDAVLFHTSYSIDRILGRK
ncbi:MAG: sugar phosphate isomerase/epimerase family protein [Candidatus Ratteibacteria bacterium]